MRLVSSSLHKTWNMLDLWIKPFNGFNEVNNFLLYTRNTKLEFPSFSVQNFAVASLKWNTRPLASRAPDSFPSLLCTDCLSTPRPSQARHSVPFYLITLNYSYFLSLIILPQRSLSWLLNLNCNLPTALRNFSFCIYCDRLLHICLS